MEWLWRPFFEHSGTRTQIFTHSLYQHYSAPRGFDFDTMNDDEPVVADKSLQTYNLDARVAELRDWLDHQNSHYTSKGHLFVVFGDDFRYANARQYFDSLDNLIAGFNAKYNDMQLEYSTPSRYIDAISSGANAYLQWPTKYDDMFPYADNPLSFWTGYFSSRANDKAYVRRASHNLHAAQRLFGLQIIDQALTQQRYLDIVNAGAKTMDALGVLQHHDAVTGTAKQAVASNYNSRVYKGMVANNKVFGQAINDMAQALLP